MFIQTIVRPFFKKYDSDNNNSLSMYELKSVFRDLGENPNPIILKNIFDEFDLDKYYFCFVFLFNFLSFFLIIFFL